MDTGVVVLPAWSGQKAILPCAKLTMAKPNIYTMILLARCKSWARQNCLDRHFSKIDA